MVRYETGLDPYLNVVTLQTTLLGNQETLASLHVLEMTNSVTLIEAFRRRLGPNAVADTGRCLEKAG